MLLFLCLELAAGAIEDLHDVRADLFESHLQRMSMVVQNLATEERLYLSTTKVEVLRDLDTHIQNHLLVQQKMASSMEDGTLSGETRSFSKKKKMDPALKSVLQKALMDTKGIIILQVSGSEISTTQLYV